MDNTHIHISRTHVRTQTTNHNTSITISLTHTLHMLCSCSTTSTAGSLARVTKCTLPLGCRILESCCAASDAHKRAAICDNLCLFVWGVLLAHVCVTLFCACLCGVCVFPVFLSVCIYIPPRISTHIHIHSHAQHTHTAHSTHTHTAHTHSTHNHEHTHHHTTNQHVQGSMRVQTWYDQWSCGWVV